MSQGFNAYREWLGVASQSEIPSYYELLGLRPLEPDTAQIEAAYQRQAARLTAQLSGGQADVAQRLMGELAEARLTLLTPTAKRAYDTALAGSLGSAGRANTSPSPVAQAATYAPFSPQPVSPQPVNVFPATPQGVQGPQPAAGYGYAGGYPAQAGVPAYHAAQPYPGWQPQPAMPAAAPVHYPAQAPAAAVPQPAIEEPAIPTIRRRHRLRRRSSPVPAVVGVLAVLAILGGTWLYFNFNASRTVAVGDANGSNPPNGRSMTSTPDTKPIHKGGNKNIANGRSEPMPFTETPAIQPPAGEDMDMGLEKPDTPADVVRDPAMSKPDADQPDPMPDKPAAEMPATERPVADKPESERPNEEPLEAKATAEEAAKVGTLLKSARAALANREIAKAQDLLAEATIEATAPETTAAVGRVELLVKYVEMFWDAVRQTLPKIGLEELEINGTMMAVVEAGENHLIIRADGKNHDYKWQKLPRSIAYYLANRWLAQDDPARHLVLASFEIVEPKGDRNQAESLLDAASAAGLKSEALREELELARGK